MSNLQMPLIRKWFEMTKTKIKKEDYREFTDYWIKRLGDKIDYRMESYIQAEFSDSSGNGYTFKKFDFNIMTLGYPKSGDTERILKLEHAGIEIRTGNPEWGAELGKIYFVIKHGEICSQ